MDHISKTAVKITISGTHRSFDGTSYGQPEAPTENYYGTLSRRGASTYIIYETKAQTGIVMNHMLKFNADDGELKKSSTLHKGTIASPASIMIYKKGEKKSGFYSTPYGRLDTLINTKELFFEETAGNVTLLASGSMEINNNPVSEFNLKIEVVMI